jgi:hypothetical protein
MYADRHATGYYASIEPVNAPEGRPTLGGPARVETRREGLDRGRRQA